jgi:ComF family protein
MVQAVENKNSPLPARPPAGAFPVLLRVWRLALDAVLPAQCLGCGTVIDAKGALCAPCWNAARFIAPPLCKVCGIPFAFDPGADALCAACVREPPLFRHARAALLYEEPARRMILGFKHGDRTESSGPFARWLVQAGAELFPGVDCVVPVPLHWTRLFARRFNQAALLANAVGRLTGLPVAVDLLIRKRRTPSQGKRGPAERARNVARAFAVRRSKVQSLNGRRVLLVDDVFTTGATATACASALLQGGAAAVDVLTLAKVVRPQP